VKNWQLFGFMVIYSCIICYLGGFEIDGLVYIIRVEFASSFWKNCCELSGEKTGLFSGNMTLLWRFSAYGWR